jgi:hypothetical protein
VFINRNETRRDVLKKAQHIRQLPENLIKRDMKVRWNTTYDMIESLIANEKVPIFICAYYKKKSVLRFCGYFCGYRTGTEPRFRL